MPCVAFTSWVGFTRRGMSFRTSARVHPLHATSTVNMSVRHPRGLAPWSCIPRPLDARPAVHV